MCTKHFYYYVSAAFKSKRTSQEQMKRRWMDWQEEEMRARKEFRQERLRQNEELINLLKNYR